MILEQCKGVHCVDLGESFPTSIYLQNFASIQPRTSLVKFARSPRTDPSGVPQLRERCRVVPNGAQDHAEVRDHPLEAGGPHPRREADPLYAGAPLHREAARDLPGREAPLSATRHLRFLIRILESLQNLVNPSIPKMEVLDACF